MSIVLQNKLNPTDEKKCPLYPESTKQKSDKALLLCAQTRETVNVRDGPAKEPMFLT